MQCLWAMLNRRLSRCFFHPYRTVAGTRVDKTPVSESGGSGQASLTEVDKAPVEVENLKTVWVEVESGPVGVTIFALRRRPGRGQGPGRLPPKVRTGDHPG